MARVAWGEDPAGSRGRLHLEPPSATRTPFARDRDRIIHTSAFRRLKEKTQVFVAHEGDHFRTRLTHSLEVAQIARSIAMALGLDADLAETIALGHDLGHPPFAHAGEEELERRMAPYGGFDHNVQTFRVLTDLERRYPTFHGLNLTWETLEGIAKHNGPVGDLIDRPIQQAGHRAVVLDDAFESLPAQVEAGEARVLPLDLGDHAEGLDVVVEAAERGHLPLQLVLAGVAERRMAEIVAQRDGLGEVGVELEGGGDRAGDLRHFQGMGQAGAVVIALVGDEHLGLFLETAKGRGVDDPVAVAGEGGAGGARRLVMPASP